MLRLTEILHQKHAHTHTPQQQQHPNYTPPTPPHFSSVIEVRLFKGNHFALDC